MRLDDRIRLSILRALARDRDAYVDGSQLAEELGVDADLLEAYADVMGEQGQVKVSKYLGGNWDVSITSRGYLEARGSDDGPQEEAAAADKPVSVLLEPGEARRKLQEQLDQLEKLLKTRRPLTLGQVEEWKEWTETVVRRTYGDSSRQLTEFQAVMGGYWRGPPPNVAGYEQRLPRWRALLKAWVREMDEFETPSDVAEQYIRPRSQFDAYVLLKDMMQTAAGSLMVVDPYTDDETLQLLRTVSPNVHARVLTVQPAKDFDHVLKLFRQQWGGKIEARQGPKELHDRFLLIDDRVFFSGASFKDLGRRGSFMAEIRTEAIKQAVKKDIEAWWKAAQPIA